MVFVPYFDFSNFFFLAQQIGFFTILLPFLLIFSIVYAILLRIEIFKKTPAAGVIVSLVIAFFALTNYQISFYMAKLFSNLAIALIILLSVVILFGLLNRDITEKAGWFFIVIVLLAAIAIIFKTFEFSIAPYFYTYFSILFPIVLILVAVILIVVFSREQPPKKGFGESLEEALFGRKGE